MFVRKSGPHTANILMKYHRCFNKKKNGDSFCTMKLEADEMKNEMKHLMQSVLSHIQMSGLFIHLSGCI